MIQEVITFIVFCGFAVWIMKEPFHWRYLASFTFLSGAVYFMFSNRFG
ncbi:MAG: DMT family protein [Chitinophagaceae bacterium]|nr:DMT family protein [Chitinophagaceae bacterium]